MKWQQHAITFETYRAMPEISTRQNGYVRIANTIRLQNYKLTTRTRYMRSLNNTNYNLHQIPHFTELKLPDANSTLIEYAAKNCFFKHDSTEDIICLVNCNQPGQTLVNDAKLVFGQTEQYQSMTPITKEASYFFGPFNTETQCTKWSMIKKLGEKHLNG